MAINPVTRHTREEHARILADYLPGGRVFGCKVDTDSTIYGLLFGLAETERQIEDIIFQIFDQYDFRTTENFLDEWERAVGLPDDCFPATAITADRQRNILAKWLSEGVQTADDFIAIAALFGVTAIITPGAEYEATFPLTFPIIFGDTIEEFPYTFPLTFPAANEARFTMYVEFSGQSAEQFTYAFPLTLGSPITAILECLFLKLAPANVVVVFI